MRIAVGSGITSRIPPDPRFRGIVWPAILAVLASTSDTTCTTTRAPCVYACCTRRNFRRASRRGAEGDGTSDTRISTSNFAARARSPFASSTGHARDAIRICRRHNIAGIFNAGRSKRHYETTRRGASLSPSRALSRREDPFPPTIPRRRTLPVSRSPP